MEFVLYLVLYLVNYLVGFRKYERDDNARNRFSGYCAWASNGIKSENFLVVILSLVIGTVIGEWLQLEEKLKHLGDWLENKVGSKGKGSISEGFVTATLILQLARWGYLVHLTVGFAEIMIFYLQRRLSMDLFLLY